MVKVSIRPFNDGEYNILAQKLCSEMSNSDMLTMVNEWRETERQGSHFEIFAVQADSELVGRVSFCEKEPDKVSIMVNLMPSIQGKEAEIQVCQAITDYVKTLGYKTITEYIKRGF